MRVNSKKITELLVAHNRKLNRLLNVINEDFAEIGSLKKHLKFHEKAEDLLLFDDLRRKKFLKNELHELFDRRLAVDALIWDMENYKIQGSIRSEKLRLLKESVNACIKYEEKNIFPKIENYLSVEKLTESGNLFVELKKKELI